MLKIAFEQPKTALEIRNPLLEACWDAAREFRLYSCFQQTQQPVFARDSEGNKTRRRTGNGKHKNWSVDFQRELPSVSKPTVVGRLAVRSAIKPEEGRYGGFDYGKYGEPSPVYTFITVHTPSELGMFNPVDPEPELLAKAHETITAYFDTCQGTLFEPTDYIPQQ